MPGDVPELGPTTYVFGVGMMLSRAIVVDAASRVEAERTARAALDARVEERRTTAPFGWQWQLALLAGPQQAAEG